MSYSGMSWVRPTAVAGEVVVGANRQDDCHDDVTQVQCVCVRVKKVFMLHHPDFIVVM